MKVYNVQGRFAVKNQDFGVMLAKEFEAEDKASAIEAFLEDIDESDLGTLVEPSKVWATKGLKVVSEVEFEPEFDEEDEEGEEEIEEDVDEEVYDEFEQEEVAA